MDFGFTCKTLRQLTILILIAMIYSAPALAQVCISDEIRLTSQEEVNNFQAKYGPCDTANLVFIRDSTDITSLAPLTGITEISVLHIVNNEALTNLDGLSGLARVGVFLYIGENPALTNIDGLSNFTIMVGEGVHSLAIVNNPLLEDLDGLSNLSSMHLGRIQVSGNPALTNIDGLSSLYGLEEVLIIENAVLTNLDALSNFTKVRVIFLDENAALSNIDGLSNLTDVGELALSRLPLTNVDSLYNLSSAGRLHINGNESLTNLDGLSSLTRVDPASSLSYPNIHLIGGLSITNNSSLRNVNGLSALQEVKSLELVNNENLADCQVLKTLLDPIDDFGPGPGPGSAGIPDITDQVEFEDNANGCNSVDQVLGFEITSGLRGAWYNPDTEGQGVLLDLESVSEFMFIAWFTYTPADSDNPFEQHWFTAQGNYTGSEADLVVYETLGGKFDDQRPVNINAVGKATLSFSGCSLGQMSYFIDTLRLAGSFPLQRAIPGSENICEQQRANTTQSLDINAGMDGAWFDENTPGQGYLIDAHPNSDGSSFIFVAWFTYGGDTASGQRWLTAQGDFEGSSASIDLYETTGGSFNDSHSVNTDKVGTMTIDFQDCNNALLTYSLTEEALNNSIAISRAIPGSQALCEELVHALR